ncbi:hypothetical protein [Bosea sp. (in: a-proteobacteria)]|uniref:LexA family protein n=1 Tax=Bosea sp. (in: a-proteobacteria) TaxID=1871050 RepID=UPI002638B9E0|nr:hypothetical protein [Bosea sp. (in: a-proteobacteria)]MCO5091969.1 hypothetical protein [Bosea sp. (in: a-proteobacteria)]
MESITGTGIVRRIMRPQDHTRAWLHYVREQLGGISWRKLAMGAKVDPSTLSRFANNEDVEHDLARKTIAGIERFSRIPYGAQAGGELLGAFADSEGAPYEIGRKSNDGRVDEQVRYICQSQSGLAPWTLTTRALEIFGYIPGDVLVVDSNAEPEDGDIVVAQNYDLRTETVFRLYQKPYLLAGATDRIVRPPLVEDGRRVVIRGVVIAQYRQRKGHLAAA